MKLDEDAHLVKVEPGDIARADALVLHQAALVCNSQVSWRNDGWTMSC